MSVDDAIENEVEREVDGLERIGNGNCEVVRVDIETITDSGLAHKVHHFGWHYEHEVHGDDDDQCQRDSISGTAVATAARAPPDTTSGRRNAQAQRAAQLDDEVDVTEYEKHERRQDTDDEVRPLVAS